jgi:hypothetical protein
MSDWLDTETKAILQGVPPEKLAPPGIAGFTLVLLSKSSNHKRLRQGLAKTGCLDSDASTAILAGTCPQIVATGLTLENALLGQFELACCDSASVFLRDEVVAEDDRDYLAQTYADLLTSQEFQPVRIEIRSVPDDERGRRFLDQFVGTDEASLQPIGLPLCHTAMKKKARFVCHWGGKIGADVRMEACDTT